MDIVQRRITTVGFDDEDVLIYPIKDVGYGAWDSYVYRKRKKLWFRYKGIITEIDNEWTFKIQEEFTKEELKEALVRLFEKGIM
jgi:hypothetical protein